MCVTIVSLLNLLLHKHHWVTSKCIMTFMQETNRSHVICTVTRFYKRSCEIYLSYSHVSCICDVCSKCSSDGSKLKVSFLILAGKFYKYEMYRKDFSRAWSRTILVHIQNKTVSVWSVWATMTLTKHFLSKICIEIPFFFGHTDKCNTRDKVFWRRDILRKHFGRNGVACLIYKRVFICNMK